MSSPPIPLELNQPLPRHVRSTGYFKFFVALLTVLFPGGGLLLLGISYGISHERAVLRTNGVPVIGQITDLKIEHSKSKDIYRVSYQFQPSLMPSDQHYFRTGNDHVSEARYR